MPAFRAGQILDWVYRKGVCDPERMTDLSSADRLRLGREMVFLSGRVLAHQVATDATQKLLIQWDDHRGAARGDSCEGDRSGSASTDPLLGTLSRPLPVLSDHDDACGDPSLQTECVMIPSASAHATQGSAPRDRRTACISSQVGCPVGCRFCASGLGGLDGNLSAGRIVEQVWRLARLEGVGRISNVVFMGMGEPLANFSQVLHAVRTLAAPWGMGIGARRITISTVGLPSAIEKLADQLELPVTLALSLHAPTDDLRRELIPWAEHATIDRLLASCTRWFEKTGREVTLEYILLGGVNDRPDHARGLASLAGSLRANVNLIRYNEVNGLPYARPATADVRRFQQLLRDAGVNVHIRASRGRDIAAACGQLRHEHATA